MTQHQSDMIEALNRVPDGTEFCAGDMAKLYGYPHKDAARVLQQTRIITVWVGYSSGGYSRGKIRYKLRDDFRRTYAVYKRLQAGDA